MHCFNGAARNGRKGTECPCGLSLRWQRSAGAGATLSGGDNAGHDWEF